MNYPIEARKTRGSWHVQEPSVNRPFDWSTHYSISPLHPSLSICLICLHQSIISAIILRPSLYSDTGGWWYAGMGGGEDRKERVIYMSEPRVEQRQCYLSWEQMSHRQALWVVEGTSSDANIWLTVYECLTWREAGKKRRGDDWRNNQRRHEVWEKARSTAGIPAEPHLYGIKIRGW